MDQGGTPVGPVVGMQRQGPFEQVQRHLERGRPGLDAGVIPVAEGQSQPGEEIGLLPGQGGDVGQGDVHGEVRQALFEAGS